MEALHEIDWSRWSLLAMGVLMVLAGSGPASGKAAATTLILAGSSLAAAALVFPRLRSVDFGGILKAEIDSDDAAYRALRVDSWKLQRFAWLVCGDAKLARDLVEEALAETRLSRRCGGDRGAYALSSLVSRLENAREHALLVRASVTRPDRPGDGAAIGEDIVAEECRPTMEALARLPVRVRMAYLLRCSWLLPVDEVVKIVAGTPGEVNEAIAQGRQALGAAL